MRNLAYFLVGVLLVALVAIAPEVMAADVNGDADSNDIYLLITAGFCCLASYMGYTSGLQR